METKLIYTKMVQVMKDIGPVTKDQKNTAQGYKFRGVDNFINALHPALVRHGVIVAPECVAEQHELRDVTRSNGKAGIDKHVNLQMKYHFYAEDGSCLTVGPIPGEGVDSGDKATNKALSAALKYALIQTFSVPTEDLVDADRESPELTSARSNQGSITSGTVDLTNATNAEKTNVITPEPKRSFRRTPKAASESTNSGTDSSGWEN